MTERRVRRFLLRYRRAILFGALGIGLLLGVRASLGHLGAMEPGELPSGRALVLALGLLLSGQVVVGYGWRRLVPALRDPVASMWTFHATQPGKYLPLGVGQAVGQVALARDLGLPFRPALAAWASHIAMICTAGVSVGALLVFRTDVGALRWLAPACLVAAVAIHRPTLQRIVGAGGRFTRRLPAPDDLPAQRGLLEAFAAGAVFVVLHGAAFAVLLGDGGDDVGRWLAVIGAYALAVGLSTASPLPAGLGIREGLLVLLVGTDAGETVAAAILLRVSAFGVEVLLLAAFWLLGRRRGQATPVPDGLEEVAGPAGAGGRPDGPATRRRSASDLGGTASDRHP